MSNPKTLPLSVVVNRRLRRFSVVLPTITAVTVGLIFGLVVATLKVNSYHQVIRAISPYLSTLVESNDRTEALQVLKSASLEERGVYELVQPC